MTKYILLLIFTLSANAQSRSEQVKLMRVPESKYKANDTIKHIVLKKWVRKGKNYFWLCSDKKYYSELLIDDLKNKK